MTIDWSKAPKRATHFVISCEERIPSGWYQADGNKMRDLAKEGEYTFRLDDMHDGRPLQIFARQHYVGGESIVPVWSGEGRPMVGNVCEWKEKSGFSWVKATVLFITESSVVLQREDGFEWQMHAKRVVFRKFKTPEQIASEEREEKAKELYARVFDHQASAQWSALTQERRNVFLNMVDEGWQKVPRA